MKKFYGQFCKVELFVANSLLMIIATLVFISAVARTIGKPVNWAQDIALLCFGWEVFLGGDIAVRTTKLVGIDMLVSRFPKIVQKYISIVFSVIILCFLAVLLRYGIPLCLDSTKRLMNTLTISYAWCTLAVPVGAGLMIISSCIRLYQSIKTPATEWEG